MQTKIGKGLATRFSDYNDIEASSISEILNGVSVVDVKKNGSDDIFKQLQGKPYVCGSKMGTGQNRNGLRDEASDCLRMSAKHGLPYILSIGLHEIFSHLGACYKKLSPHYNVKLQKQKVT
nr:phenazine biosynthesis PhzC/PhzF protein [Tanacetum cinerariifolium]